MSIIQRLLALLFPSGQGRIAFVQVAFRGATIKGEITMVLLTDSQEIDLAIKPLTKKGHPAQIDGTPVWASSDPQVATVNPAADGLSCVVKAGANLGTVQISVSADADLGAGVTPLTGILDIEVIGGGAATMSIIAGTPREQA